MSLVSLPSGRSITISRVHLANHRSPSSFERRAQVDSDDHGSGPYVHFTESVWLHGTRTSKTNLSSFKRRVIYCSTSSPTRLFGSMGTSLAHSFKLLGETGNIKRNFNQRTRPRHNSYKKKRKKERRKRESIKCAMNYRFRLIFSSTGKTERMFTNIFFCRIEIVFTCSEYVLEKLRY